eukprot:COSAG01_NODE_17158_length_1173_cov_4.437107_1_plen_92_part_00
MIFEGDNAELYGTLAKTVQNVMPNKPRAGLSAIASSEKLLLERLADLRVAVRSLPSSFYQQPSRCLVACSLRRCLSESRVARQGGFFWLRG